MLSRRSHLGFFEEEELIVAQLRRQQLAAALAATETDGRGPQDAKTDKSIGFTWEAHVARLDEAEFKRRYRLTAESFYALHDKLEPHLVKHEKFQQLATFGRIIETYAVLACAIRFMAGGMVTDLKLIYDLSYGGVYNCIWSVVDAIHTVPEFKCDFPLGDTEKLDILEGEFAAQSRCPWRGQVGAVDGVLFKMLRPSARDVDDPKRYHVSRKDMYALLCIAVCDARRRILYYDISCAPTTHDSLAWGASSLGIACKAGRLPSKYFFNGDSAFSASAYMATPSGNDPALDDYDFFQSSNRMPIECAFGIIVRRWGVLWRALSVRFDRRAPLIGACIKLHNFCINTQEIANSWEALCNEIPESGGLGACQPGRWRKIPRFDREGRPLDCFTDVLSKERLADESGTGTLQARLALAVRESGSVRPRVGSNCVRKVKGKRGGRKKK